MSHEQLFFRKSQCGYICWRVGVGVRKEWKGWGGRVRGVLNGADDYSVWLTFRVAVQA